MSQLQGELRVLAAAPIELQGGGGADRLANLKRRVGRFSALQLLIKNEQRDAAKLQATQLSNLFRSDARRVFEFSTQAHHRAPRARNM